MKVLAKTLTSVFVGLALIAGLSGITSNAASAAPAPMTGVSVNDAKTAALVANRKKQQREDAVASCKNPLAQTLYRAGFRGKNHREAWAIAMRESNGNEKEISPSSDYGLFQFNAPSWSGASWWDWNLILDGEYNARVAYKMSKGGKTWYPWGLDGQGNLDSGSYGGWSDSQVYAWIVEPYQRYYRQYPC